MGRLAMRMADWITVGRMDELARSDSPVHRLDARAKVVVTLAFIVTVMSFPRYAVSALTPFLLYPVGLLVVGQIPAAPILKKVLMAAPFALVIGMFNPFLDRQHMLTLGPVAITGGWLSFTSILLRFILTMTAAMALIACTGMYRLGAALEQVRVPRVFVVQLLFLYRYVFVVAEEGVKMLHGVETRSAGAPSLSLRVYGSLTGHLLLRSLDRADRIHRAMVARGFDGEIRSLRRARWRWTDGVFVALCLAGFLVARIWNLAELFGGLVAGGAR